MQRLLRTPRGMVGAAVVAVLLLGAIGVGVLYLVVFPTSAPKKLGLSTTTPTPSSSATAQASAGAGTWTVTTGSVAGYRVREQLFSLQAPSDAVGRTSSVMGSMTLAQNSTGYQVTAASFNVDVSSLTSDRSMRDQRIHSMGLESSRYPTATFKLTTPIDLPSTASTGQAVHVSAIGDLTIHGTTRSVTIPMDARFSGGQVEAAGSITFPFAQFNMTPPSIPGFVSVTDNATMEFDLHFKQQGA